MPVADGVEVLVAPYSTTLVHQRSAGQQGSQAAGSSTRLAYPYHPHVGLQSSMRKAIHALQ
eukprot:1161910-Pelagomonas_calceolata.AAC.1